MHIRMKLRDDKSEQVRYNFNDFPAYIRKGILSQYPNYSAVSHWHDDIELISVLSGRMQYNINGTIITMKEGEGVFVNARQLHFGFSPEKEECIFLCVLLHPMLLCTSRYLEQRYVTPLISNEQLSYCFLTPEIDWQKHILDNISRMYQCNTQPSAELKIQSCFFHLWSDLYSNLHVEESFSTLRNPHLYALKEMISFIQKHYKEKITLSDLCSAGAVGKTTCNTIFQNYIHQTPMEYLTDYRLRQSIELMKTTDLNLSEICYEVGFSGASYYAETFKKQFGISPTEYKKELFSIVQ